MSGRRLVALRTSCCRAVRPRSTRSTSALISWRGSFGRTRGTAQQTNARFLTADQVPEPIDIVVCDASFIALAKVLEAPLKLVGPGAKLVALVKPQFEAGREDVGKGGVVRDPEVHERVCAQAKGWVESQGWTVLGVTPSPITGPEGNIEFLLGAEKNG